MRRIRAGLVLINEDGEVFIENPETAESVLVAPRLTPPNAEDAKFIIEAANAWKRRLTASRH